MSNSAEYWVGQTQTTYTWSGLQPSRTYQFVVYAIDSAGNRSANSNQVTVTTPAASPPGVPTNLRVTGATPNTLSFAWDAAPNAVRYQLHSPVGGTHNVTGTSYTVHWLQTDSAYTFTVRAVNAVGTMSAPSAPVTGRTLRDTTAPKRPGGAHQLCVQPVRDPAQLGAVDRRLQLRVLQRRRQRQAVAAHAAGRQHDDVGAQPARRHRL